MESTKFILPEILESKLKYIRDICRKHHVKYLWVFGSIMTSGFQKESDIDFLYELDESSLGEGEYLPNLDGLINGLLSSFPNRKIDLVHYPSLKNPYFIEEVEETKVLLYDKNREEVSV